MQKSSPTAQNINLTNTVLANIAQANIVQKGRRLFLMLAILALSQTLFYCAQKPASVTELSPQQLTRLSLNDAEKLIEKASTSRQPKKDDLYLQAVEIIIAHKNYDYAEEVLAHIDSHQLTNEHKAIYLIDKAKIYLFRQQATEALSLFKDNFLGVQDFQYELPLPTQIKLSETKSQAYASNGDFLSSAKERIFIGPLMEKQEQIINNQVIWQLLSLLETQFLMQQGEKSTDKNIEGWLKLAHINKAYQDNIDLQLEELDQWLYDWKDHDAAKALPSSLSLLKKAAQERPKQIALLLPNEGIYAKNAAAIRKGFMLGYYHAVEKGALYPVIKHYDTSPSALKQLAEQRQQEQAESSLLSFFAKENDDTSNLNELTDELTETTNTNNSSELPANEQIKDNNSTEASTIEEKDTDETVSISESGFLLLYEQAVAEGADLIIGPLNKKHIEELQSLKSLPVNTLALNYTSGANNDIEHSPDELYQFGLAPEDELEFIAKQAHLKGFKNAVVLAPEGAWGERLSINFANKWNQYGGDVISVHNYDKNKVGHANLVIKSMLNINRSEKRASRLRRYSLGKIKSEPRIRKDIDFIFLVSSAKLGRQIMPSFSFHYAGDIPVFSTSHVYGGKKDSKDRDLSRLIFSDIPWVLSPDKTFQDTFNQAWPNSAQRYSRLNAMGLDAFRLSSRLGILSASESKMFGATGLLQLDDNKKIKRHPTLAKFRSGRARVIPTLIETNIEIN